MPPPRNKKTGVSKKDKERDAQLRKASKEYASQKVTKLFQDSTFPNHTTQVPQFETSELHLGKLLGKGGFGTVKEITSFTIHEGVKPFNNKKNKRSDEEDPEVMQGEREGRLFIARHCIRNNSDARYAIKYLSKEVVDDPGLFCQGIIDMAIETRFLSALHHTNIIKLRAIGNMSPYQEDYFLVLDRLYDILDHRMKKWKAQLSRKKSLLGSLSRKKMTEAELFTERLCFAYDLASALEYLHLNLVIYRDVKPENIGFDVRGDIKIFDFGLAKELHPNLRHDDGTYNLTARTGSLIYMAPEVALAKPYKDTADVYSMTILLWEMLALDLPFSVTYTHRKYETLVHLGGKRPKLKEEWSPELKETFQEGWHPEHLRARLTMGELAKKIREEIVRLRGGDESGLDNSRRSARSLDNSRRSTHSFNSNEEFSKASQQAVQ